MTHLNGFAETKGSWRPAISEASRRLPEAGMGQRRNAKLRARRGAPPSQPPLGGWMSDYVLLEMLRRASTAEARRAFVSACPCQNVTPMVTRLTAAQPAHRLLDGGKILSTEYDGALRC